MVIDALYVIKRKIFADRNLQDLTKCEKCITIQSVSFRKGDRIIMDIQSIKDTAAFLMSKIKVLPKLAIILGTGLGDFANRLEDRIEIPYCNIPNFPVSTVDGHIGRFIFGKLAGKYVIAMQGRVHYYEGYSMQEITFPIWVLREMGVKTLIVTNAAGAINESYEPGDLILVADHIKMCADSPLRGVGNNEYGGRFHDMTHVYDARLAETAKEVAYGMGIPLEEGVYAFMGGPQFETPAEVRMLSLFGADIVGMSTVPEVIVASHVGMSVLAISCVTNYAAGISDKEISHGDVSDIGYAIKDKFELLMSGIIERIKTIEED